MKIENIATIAGYLYDVKNLEYKTVKNQASKNFNKTFIGGTLVIATDEDGLNLINVEYPFVMPTTSKGKADSRYAILDRILKEKKTWVEVGKENAFKMTIGCNAAANDYYDQSGTLVTRNAVMGGFDIKIVSVLPELKERDYYKCTVLLHTCTHVEADPEKDIANDYLKLTGYAFNYNGTETFPLTFVLRDPRGFDIFEGYDMSKSNPVLTTVWGHMIAQDVVITTVEESSFGDASVTKKHKLTYEWVLSGASPNVLEYDTEDTITKENMNKMLQNREVALAERKKNWEDYRNSKSAEKPSEAASNTVKPGEFKF